MRRVGEGVDQRHGKRFHAPPRQLLQFRLQRLDVQFVHHRSVGADALVRFDSERQRRNRQALVVDHPAAQAARHEGTGDLQHLPVAPGGNQADLGARPREDGVGGHRSPVHDMSNVAGIDARIAADPVDAVGHADRRILRRAGDFCGVHLPRLLVNQEQVGKSTAHIHAQAKAHAISPVCISVQACAPIATSGKIPARGSMAGKSPWPSCSRSQPLVSIIFFSDTPVSTPDLDRR